MHKICKGDKKNDNIDGDDVDSVYEVEMGSITDTVNDNDDVVSRFDVSTFLFDNVYNIFDH